MAYVNIDIDLDEFDTYELVDELIARMKRIGRKGMPESEKKKLIEEVKPLIGELNEVQGMPNKSLDDKMKHETLIREWERFTSFELEMWLQQK